MYMLNDLVISNFLLEHTLTHSYICTHIHTYTRAVIVSSCHSSRQSHSGTYTHTHEYTLTLIISFLLEHTPTLICIYLNQCIHMLLEHTLTYTFISTDTNRLIIKNLNQKKSHNDTCTLYP